MDRRTFVLLTGATSGALLRPPVRLSGSPTWAHRRSGEPAVGRLRFELDARRRWSLWYYGDGAPVPLVRDGEVVTWLADRSLTLTDLEDSTVGSRRPPGGDAIVVRGRAAGVWVEAEFLTAGVLHAPQGAAAGAARAHHGLPSLQGDPVFSVPGTGVEVEPGAPGGARIMADSQLAGPV